MSSTITGDATAADLYLSRTVTGATNASPIVITTSANHLFATGDRVIVASVGGNTAANGEFYITKISATTFSLDGSTGNGAYTAGGTAACVTLTPQFTIPADGDNLDAASVNVALEALADRTQILALAVKNRIDEFTASGTWTCPDNVFSVVVEGCGGGGGGAGGGGSNTTTDRDVAGGGGGSGAPRRSRVVAVTPGTTYTVTIGAGGAGGAAGASGNNMSTAGSDGASTTFDTLATFAGGSGAGRVGYLYATVRASGNACFGVPGQGKATSAPKSDGIIMVGRPGGGGPGSGGYGGCAVSNTTGGEGLGFPGVDSAEGYAGGASGLEGGDSGSYRSGGPGGGGGGGAYGVGGDGGNGGAGNYAGAGTAGGAGTAAAANTGAGGGGGGGGGHGTSGAAGGAGAAGGSGRCRVFYVGPKATVT